MPDTFPATARLRRRVLSTVVTISLALAGVVVLAPPAHAAGYGPSYDLGNGHLGAFSVGGVNVYCLEILKARPVGATSGPVYQGWGSLSPLDLARINMAVTSFGQSTDRRMTAAVHLYVWSIADAAEYNSHGMSGDSWFIARATAADIPTIRANLATIRAVAAGTTVGTNGTGSATVSVQMFDSYDGQVTVAVSPASAVGTLHLDGAVVAGTPADTAPVSDGSVIPIRGIPLDGQTEEYAITASATFTVSNAGGYLGQIGVYTTGAAQRLAGPGGQAPATYSFDASAFVTDPLELQFEPIITTTVADAMLQPGSPLVDHLTVGLSPTSPSSKWREWETGGFMTVIAEGTLLGPFANPPAVGVAVPSDAPVAWTELITLSGPGTYSTSGGFVASKSGYYSWVWSIDFDAQDPFVQPYLTSDYEWRDAFGQAAETAVVAVTIEATSQVSDAAVGLWRPVFDTVTVTHDPATGPWWTADGLAPIAARFLGTAYWLAGETPPTISSDPPPEAVTLGTREFDSIGGPGSYSTSSITAPQHENGFIVWQWELVGDDAGLFVAWRDDFGVPSETTRVTVPILTTNAEATVPATGEATDSATIGGEPTGESTFLSFAVYRQSNPDVPVCDATNLVADSVDDLIEVTNPGDYISRPVILEEVGIYAWIATLWSAEGQVVAAGECGEDGETTEVVPFIVATEAVETVNAGGLAHDVATIVGPTPPGAEISFAAYRQEDDMIEPVCEDHNRVFSTIEAPVQLNGPGVYQSAETNLDQAGTYLWVESVHSRTGQLLHDGECGAQYEVTNVQSPTLAFTGASSILLVGAIGLIAICSGGVLIRVRGKSIG